VNTSEKIYQEACQLPESLAREVLDFIGYLKNKYAFPNSITDNLKEAQTPIMQRIWDNVEDEVWNDL
jgi:hypothetical protein